jgi:hypothetical protein
MMETGLAIVFGGGQVYVVGTVGALWKFRIAGEGS